MRHDRIVLLLLLLAALCVSCAADAGDRSGGSGPLRTLVLANNDAGLEGAPAVARFVERLQKLSGGRVRVDVQSSWGGGSDEAGVIRAVGSGEADLGWAGTRAFDTVGVDSFRPLHAPLLVGSYAAEAALVQSSLAPELLASLAPLGVTGLALAADQLRVPASKARPLLDLADLQGLTVRTAASEVQQDGLRALGALPAVSTGSPAQLADLDAVETMWWTYANGLYADMPFVTRNAALWPRSLAVFANTELLDGLDEQHRGWISEAAQDAASWSSAHAGDRDAEQIRRACEAGARVATATPEQLTALRAAAEPVYEALSADPSTARVLERVQALVDGIEPRPLPELPEGCAYRPGEELERPAQVQALTGPGAPGDLPQGVYRYALRREQLLADGQSEQDADGNAGVFTFTLRAGSWRYEQQPAVPGNAVSLMTTCEGWYTARGDTVSFTTTTTYADGICAPATWAARWRADGDRLLWSDNTEPDFEFFFGSVPWERIQE